MKRFVSLIAVSSEKQATPDKVSLSDQRDGIAREVDRWGGVLTEELEIPGHTRSYASLQEAEQELPAYKRLHELIVSEAVDVLIFFNYSRLARDIGLGGNIVSLCQRHKITLYQSSSPPSDLTFRKDAMQLFMASFGLAGSHNEIDELTRRNEQGMKNRTRRGEFPGGKLPWGWKKRHDPTTGERTVVIDENAQRLLLTIIQMYLEGRGAPTIAEHMGSIGAKTPAGSNTWNAPNITRMMQKIWRYAGVTEINRKSPTGREYIRADLRWPAPVDHETATLVEAEWKRRRHGGRYVNSPHRFSGMVWCKDCEKPMTCSWERRKDAPREYEIIRCMNGHSQIPARRVDAYLREFFSSAQWRAKLEPPPDNADAERVRLEGLIKTSLQELAKVDAGVQRVNDSYALMEIDRPERERLLDLLRAKRGEIEARLQGYQAALASVDRQSNRAEKLESFYEVALDLLAIDDVVAANAAMRPLVKVWVSRGKVIDADFV